MKKLIFIILFLFLNSFTMEKSGSTSSSSSSNYEVKLANKLRKELTSLKTSLEKLNSGSFSGDLEKYLALKELTVYESTISDMLKYLQDNSSEINSKVNVKLIGSDTQIRKLPEHIESIQSELDKYSVSDLKTENIRKIKSFLKDVIEPIKTVISIVDSAIDEGKLNISKYVSKKEGLDLGELTFEENLIFENPELKKLIELNKEGKRLLTSMSIKDKFDDFKAKMESLLDSVDLPSVDELENKLDKLNKDINLIKSENSATLSSKIQSKIAQLQKEVASIISEIEEYQKYSDRLQSTDKSFGEFASSLNSYLKDLDSFGEVDFPALKNEYQNLKQLHENLIELKNSQSISSSKIDNIISQVEEQLQTYHDALEIYKGIDAQVIEEFDKIDEFQQSIKDIDSKLRSQLSELNEDLEYLSSFQNDLDNYSISTQLKLEKIRDFSPKVEQLESHIKTLKDIRFGEKKDGMSTWSRIKDWFKEKVENIVGKDNFWNESGSLTNKIKYLENHLNRIKSKDFSNKDIDFIQSEYDLLKDSLEKAQKESWQYGRDISDPDPTGPGRDVPGDFDGGIGIGLDHSDVPRSFGL